MAQRSVLITGCSSGIGRCLADNLRTRGYRVFATARRPADVASLIAAGHESFLLDLASSDSIHAAVATVLERTGNRLYALINNGAYGQAGAVEDLSRAALREQFETNVFGTHELTARLVPIMRAQREGRIVQISSLLGIVCLPYRGAYNASKFALEALSDTLRLELYGSGVHVSLIEPGPITSSFRRNSQAAFHRHVIADNSSHRDQYHALERRLNSDVPQPFTLPASALVAPVLHALEASRPRIRYPVTFPARLFTVLRRLLPGRLLDRTLLAISGGGRR